MKFRKKPVVIDAFQMTKKQRLPNNEWPVWLHVAWNTPSIQTGALLPAEYPPDSDGGEKLAIYTFEGRLIVDWNDWIIRGIQGELYPCKPDIFLATYEPVGDGE